MAVSEWCSWKTGCVQNASERVQGIGCLSIDLIQIRALDTEGLQDRGEVRPIGGLITGDPHGVRVDQSKVDSPFASLGHHGLGPSQHAGLHRVEEALVDQPDPAISQGGSQDRGHAVGP
jgi:hypothetical protein